ncbi:protein transport protein Sec31, partial [Trypanosoma grayi]|uniref:protein transport protein Sec31 n=1 Tax=Trypanosoma grayi TaxID=71804 RepID=UPI0004F40738
MAGRKTARDASSDDGADVTQPPVVPLTTTLLSSRIRRELQNTWNAARTTHEAGRRGDGNSVDGDNAVEVPAFKVGTLEMYRRFPRQYDLIMRRHDCSAVQDYLDGLLTTLQRSTTAATAETEAVKSATEGEGEGTREEHTSVSEKARVLHVADFGCGTGRIASMVSRHPSVGAVYCYDSETAMLRQCVCNVVRSVAVARPDTCGVRLLPAADSANNNNDNDDDDDDAAAKAVDDGAVYIGDERGANPAGGVVRLCARPASFTDVQRGFLAAH